MGQEFQYQEKLQQNQRFALSNQQQQSLKILQYSAQELEAALTAALAGNPLLEYEDLNPESVPPAEPEEEEKAPATEDEACESAVNVEKNSDEWRDELPLSSGGGESEEGESALDPFAYAAAPPPDLHQQLETELELTAGISPEKRRICAAIIDALDDSGYLRTPLADIAMNCNASLPECEAALLVVQSFDPPGIGARDLAENWKLQLMRTGKLTPLLDRLLAEQTDNLSANRPDRAAEALGISLAELKEQLAVLRRLKRSPVPGSGVAQILFPDAEIVADEKGGFSARLTRERRRYYLSPDARYADAPDAGAEFKQKVREAQTLLEALEFRKSTLLRLTELLIAEQRPFLEQGADALLPFSEKQAAEKLQFKNESSISRAIAGKSVATPQGTYPFKFFFTQGYVKQDGTQVSRRSDMEKLRELVENEDKIAPLSDDRLAELLQQSGHPVARRTVVKYRKLMNIPNSNLRRKIL